MVAVSILIALGILGVVCLAGVCWLLYLFYLEESPSEYQMLVAITANHKPARALPIDLRYPSVPETRDVTFDMLEAGCPHIVRVVARNMSVREWKALVSDLPA